MQMPKRALLLPLFLLINGGLFFPFGHAFAADPAPAAYWKLDETSGTTAADSSGNGHNGTVHGTPDWVAGKFGNAFSFDGSTNYIATGYTFPAQDSSTSFTWATWMYAASGNPSNVVVLGWRAGDTWIKLTASGLEYGNGMLISHSLATGGWVHVVITKDGSSFKYYQAGELVGSGTSAASTQANQFYLGSDPGFDDGYFSGKLDDVRIYNTALTPDQVDDLYADASIAITDIASTTASTSATITWTTGTAADSKVEYGTTSGTYTNATSSAALVTSHSLGISNLTAGTPYYFVVVSKDGSGNTATSSEETVRIPDTTPPSIGALSASAATASSTTVTWTTNELASSKLVYSVDDSYASSTAETNTSPRVTSHSITVASLLSCTTYNAEAVSADASGNYATSTAISFDTTGCPGGATPSVATSTAITTSAAATSTVSTGGHTFTVSTPANVTATSSSLVIQIKGLPSDTVLGSIGKPSSSLSSAASVVFDVTALINNTTVLDSFDHPVTITYHYTDADVSGLDESSLQMYHYHDDAWLPLNNCSVDTSANTITCTAPSFSTFAIFGTPSSTSSSTAATRQSGYTIQSQVANLMAMGKTAEAAALEREWYWLFPSAQATASSSTKLCPYYHFTRVLRFGEQGQDVKALQQFLNCSGFPLGINGPGSPGNETVYFADRTLASVDAFQEAYATSVLVPVNSARATGIFAKYSQKAAYRLMKQ